MTPKFCKAAFIDPKGQVVCRKMPIPQLKEHEVLVKVHASLISPGTEMNAVKSRRATPTAKGTDMPFGYSTAGEIVAVNGDCKGLKPGMRVACMGGGAKHASYNCVPVNLVVPIPDKLSFEEAAFASLAATSLQAVHRTEPQLGEYGIVLGQGIVGNLAAQLCQLSGTRILAWEALPFRIAIAKKCKIMNAVNFLKKDAVQASKDFAAPYGLDFAIMAFGGDANKAFENVRASMKVSADGHQMGRITVVGGCHFDFFGGATNGNLDIRCSSRTGCGYHDTAWEYGKDYPNAFVQFTSQRNAAELIRLMAEKRLLVEPMISHRMKIEEVGTAADLLVEQPNSTLGVILTM